MSLINEALKKAQRQRTLDAAPLSGAPSGIAAAAVTTHVAVASHRRSLAPLWFGLGLLALGVGATVLVMSFRFDPAPTPTPIAAAPAAVAVSTPVTPASPQTVTPVVEAPAAVVTLPSFNPPPVTAAPRPTPVAAPATPPPAPPPVPVPTVPVSAPAAPVVALTPAAIAPALPAPTPPPAAAPTTPVAPVADLAAEKADAAARSARVYDFLNTLRLTGVRGLGAEARVLMNERVWRLNDVISPELGLRLSAVRPGLLVFTDASGRTYEKPH